MSIRRGGKPNLGLIFGLTFLAATTHAKIGIDVNVGYHETFTSGSWTPFRVIVDNNPDPEHPSAKVRDFAGMLRVTVVDLNGTKLQYERPVELPHPSRKLVEFSLQLPERATPITVELIDRREGAVARKEYLPGASYGMALSDKRRDWLGVPTVLLVADPNENPSLPNWLPNSAVNIQRIERELLPSDPKGYDGVRVVVIRQKLSGRVNEAQLKALQSWVEFGGALLVVTPKAQAELKQDSWLTERLPGAIEGSVDVKLDALAAGSGDEMTLKTDWASLQPGAQKTWDSPAGPLAISRPVGAGHVIALSIDPSGLSPAALKTSLGRKLQMFVESLVLGPAREDLRARHYWSTADVDPDFSQILLLPNIWVVTLLLITFVVVVGPLNFYLLRRRRRLELAWFTIPALSILFFLAVYGYGLAAKGGDQHYASAEILHLSAGEPEGLLLWDSIQFSPRKRVYRIGGPEASVILPLLSYYDNPADYTRLSQTIRGITSGAVGAAETGSPGSALATKDQGYELFYPAEQWKMAFYQGERPIRIEGNIDGRVTLSSDGSVTGHVRNNTGALLSGAVLCVGLLRYNIGDLPPNGEFDQTFSGQNLPAGRAALEQARQNSALAAANAATASQANAQRAMMQRAQQQRLFPGGGPVTQQPVQSRNSDGTLALPGDDKFQLSVTQKVFDGAKNAYPLFTIAKPQRRCRLIARQTEWTSGVKIDPAPDFTKVCALVEVELPLEIEGAVDLASSIDLRGDVYDFDPNETTFFTEPADLCNLRESWVELVFSPPALYGAARVKGGEVIIDHTPFTHVLAAFAFNYATANWDLIAQGPDPYVNGGIRQIQSPINENWINPMGNLMRIRLTGIPLQTKTALQRNGFGIAVHSVYARMTLAGEKATAENKTAAGSATP